MKRFSVSSLAVLVIAAVIAAGSVSFLSPCVHEDGSFGACHWAGQAMLGIGMLLAAESLAALLVRDGRVRTGLLAAASMTALLGCLIPGTLIDLCRMATMHCRSVMQPAMILLCALACVTALIGCWMEIRRGRGTT